MREDTFSTLRKCTFFSSPGVQWGVPVETCASGWFIWACFHFDTINRTAHIPVTTAVIGQRCSGADQPYGDGWQSTFCWFCYFIVSVKSCVGCRQVHDGKTLNSAVFLKSVTSSSPSQTHRNQRRCDQFSGFLYPNINVWCFVVTQWIWNLSQQMNRETLHRRLCLRSWVMTEREAEGRFILKPSVSLMQGFCRFMKVRSR